MNIILPNGQKVPTIKGWELEGVRVVAIHEATLNGAPLKVYLTNLNFYVYLNEAWYNGGLISQNHAAVEPILSSSVAALRTSRSYRISTPDIDLSHMEESAVDVRDDSLVDGHRNMTEEEVDDSYLNELNPKIEELNDSIMGEPKFIVFEDLHRVMKKEARELKEKGSRVFVVKYNKKQEKYLSETTTEISDFESSLESFFTEMKSNKDNTHFMVLN